MRLVTKWTISSLLFIGIPLAHAQTITEHDRAFIQQTVTASIKQSEEYQNIQEECNELGKEAAGNIDCQAFNRALSHLDFLFQTGRLSKNHDNDIAAIVNFCLYSGTGCYQWHLFVFLRQDDGALKLLDRIALLSQRGGIHHFKIEHGDIFLHTFAIGKDDPGCCPSIKKSFKYSIHNEKLVEFELK